MGYSRLRQILNSTKTHAFGTGDKQNIATLFIDVKSKRTKISLLPVAPLNSVFNQGCQIEVLVIPKLRRKKLIVFKIKISKVQLFEMKSFIHETFCYYSMMCYPGGHVRP